MKVLVQVNLPDLKKNLSPEDRGSLRWAGVSMRMLSSSWGVALSAVLRRVYPDDQWEVRVRSHPSGPPRFSSKGTTMPMTPDLQIAMDAAALSWLAGIGHLTMLRMNARKSARK